MGLVLVTKRHLGKKRSTPQLVFESLLIREVRQFDLDMFVHLIMMLGFLRLLALSGLSCWVSILIPSFRLRMC